MAENIRILVVDDEPLNHDLISVALKNDYKLDFVENGEAGIAYLATTIPDLILLDIRMTGISGYDVCRKIKADERTAAIPVIFVSSLDSLEERLAGYDAGAEDYVVKPFNSQELRSKVKVAVAYKSRMKALESEKHYATQAVMEALTNTGELGIVLNYLTKSYTCNDAESVGKSLIDALAGYGLKCAAMIDLDGKQVVCDSDDAVKPLEVSLLNKLKGQGRFFDFGARTVVNFSDVSLLVKNMPLEDGMKNGRYRDHIALLVEGAQARITGLKAEFSVKKQKEALAGLIEKYQSILSDFRESSNRYKKLNAHLFDELVLRMETEFTTLGLAESQEDRLIQLVAETAERGMKLYEEGIQADDQLNKVLEELRAASR